MKLRRAMAAAATTAVIAPIALLSAPAAFATGESTPTPAASESTPAAEASTPAAEESTPASEESTPAAEESTPAAEESTPTAEESTPGAGESSPAASPSPSASESAPEEEVDFCEQGDEDSVFLNEDLQSGLSGLPETIVAGSGWTKFSFNVSNNSDQDIKNIKPVIGVYAIGWDDAKEYSGEITVEVFNNASGSWETLADAAGEGATFTTFPLDAGQSTSFKLRLSVSGKVPDSLGLTGGFAQYSDADGCWIADDPNGWTYIFDILAAGSDAGDPNDAKPQTGGQKPIEDVKEVAVTGELAATGSDSNLPVIATIGGVAIVAGAGVVFAMKRRRVGAEA
ncbi:LPXTG cell wall anchor domain-containing protein [Streptomyces dysideae]|uniref:LPXTG cell wall anchor domain-containing protein n=1 Tax=Streptomyces dysideae TaxID=909626 RepID=A0A124IFE9_9ACTN|nr:LPXTG cell wall anchor domain-containing protein [Streptomyces dysideae]KUO21197.1 hypothetical protein AQJ91_10445 [Streptomyces dysideae]